MKTEVYSWRVSAEKKAELEEEARREGTSLSALLDDITSNWLSNRLNGSLEDDAEQVRIRRAASRAIGSVSGGNPNRSSQASQLVRKTLEHKHARESNASHRVD